MSKVFNIEQIKEIIETLDISEQLEEGFIAYSKKQVIVPPVGELLFDNPPGDTHIKYGFIKEDDYFVIKVASGFYENYKLNLPSSSGVMLLFSQKSGELISVLMDEGYLTNIRTAIAGQIVAKYMAPKKIDYIGVFGTGIQAKLQVEYLKSITDCNQIIVWGRNKKSLNSYKLEMEAKGYFVEVTSDSSLVTSKSNFIITATPSTTPLIKASQLLPGTHITAMGSDTSEKQEIDPFIVNSADIVVVDSLEQSVTRGEVHKAVEAGYELTGKFIELGEIIMKPSLGRTNDSQLTIADLTGVAVQDIQIAKAVYKALVNASSNETTSV